MKAFVAPTIGFRAIARSAALRKLSNSFRKNSAYERASYAKGFVGEISTARCASLSARPSESGSWLNPNLCSSQYMIDSIAQQLALPGVVFKARSNDARIVACSLAE